MAKIVKPKKYSATSTINKVEEQMALYVPIKKIPTIAEFTFKKFEKIAAKISFTQKEWAGILHLSERTLQRYAKENKRFEGIYTDRILHIEQLINAGLETFVQAEPLYRWLKREKNVLGQTLNFESLTYTKGIQDTIDELGRIKYGVYI